MSTDLRLVPAALAAWATAWTLTGTATGAGEALAVLRAAGLGVAVVGVFVLAVAARGAVARSPQPTSAPAPAAPAPSVPAPSAPAPSAPAPSAPARSVPAPPPEATGRAVGSQVFLVLAVVTVVALSVQVHDAGRAPLAALGADRAHAVLEGRVVSEVRASPFGAGQTWTLAVDRVTARATTSAVRAHVEVTTAERAPAYAARVVVEAALTPARPGTAFAARATAEGAGVVRAPPAVVRATTTVRAALLDVTADLSPQAQGLVPGIAVGDTSRLPPDLEEAFRTTGLTHLTAVSGGHFAIVLALVTALAGVFRAPRWLRVVVVAVVAAGFVLLVRPEPAVLRAAAMCAVTLLGIVLGRPAASVPSLAACATVLLVLDPWLARSFGFALSCAATAGLVLLTPPLLRRLAPWLGRPAAYAVAVPTAAQLACGPVLVLLSPSLPTTSVLANLLAAPAVAPATLLGLAAALTAPWAPAVAGALAWLAGVATWWIATVARWCAGLPGAALPWPGGAVGALALALATAAVLLLVLRRPPGAGWPVSVTDAVRRRWRNAPRDARAAAARFRAGLATRRDRRLAVLAGACAALLVVVTTTAVLRLLPASGEVPEDWQVVACDVGQGDALVVRTGQVSAVVVDAGPPGPAAGRCLDRLGVTTVDLLVLTHHHLDHVGGLPGVLDDRAVRQAWLSPLDVPAANARQVRAALTAAGVVAAVPETGAGGELGEGRWGVVVRMLGTGTGAGTGSGAGSGLGEGDGANDASLAVALTSRGPGGTVEVVALGDLEEPGQEALLATLRGGTTPEVSDGVDIVKVAHHGSASQSGALARLLHPRVALVSVGEENTYGHPTDRMLDLYTGLGAQVVRTDECGTAVLVTRDGEIGLACG